MIIIYFTNESGLGLGFFLKSRMHFNARYHGGMGRARYYLFPRLVLVCLCVKKNCPN